MNHNLIIIEEVYPVSPEKVWKALTDKEEMKKWYFTIEDFVPEVGAEFNFYEPGGHNLYHHRCRIRELVAQKRLSHTWTYPKHSAGVSVVTWDLKPVGDGTKVALTHSGLETFADGGEDFAYENFEAGWNEILKTSLKNYLLK